MGYRECIYWSMNMKETSGRPVRQMVDINDFDFIAHYVAVSILNVPDSLSQNSVKPKICPHCKEKIRFIVENSRRIPLVM